MSEKEEIENLKVENARLRDLLSDCLDTFEVVVDGRNEIAQGELKRKLENELSNKPKTLVEQILTKTKSF